MVFDPSLRHPLYEKWYPKWQRQRDAVEGEDRMKASPRRREYVPALSGQSTNTLAGFNPKQVFSTYESYLGRASFLNATGRTVEGLIGAVMRKAPEVIWPSAQEDVLDIVGHSLESFDEVIDETLEQVVGVGRYGHLVDLPQDEGDSAEPFIALYIAETITDWEIGVIGGRKHNIRVNLSESSGQIGINKKKELDQYRVLRLGIPMPVTEEELKMHPVDFLALWGLVMEDLIEGPLYFQELWLEVDQTPSDASSNKTRFTRADLIVPRAAGGVLLREIPWTFFNPTGCQPKPNKPTLLDLTVINIAHFRNSADLENGLHFTGLPQPWISGFKFKGELMIGSGAAWVTEEPGANAQYLEFSGQGLGAIRAEMDVKKKHMGALGARLLEEQTTAGNAEAAETVRLRHSGEGSALAKLAKAVSKGLTRTLEFLARFRGMEAAVSCELNTDFGVEGLSPDMLGKLMEQVQGGLMSWDVYVYNVKRGELYPDDFDPEEEAAAIQAGPPNGDPTTLLDPKPESTHPPDDGEEDDGSAEDDKGAKDKQ